MLGVHEVSDRELYGTIISMTSTEVNEKLLSAPDIDVIKKDLDPLELWKSVIGILVSKSGAESNFSFTSVEVILMIVQ